MNGGDIIARILQKHGVQFLFTLCGGHISPIFVGAEKIGIRVIDTRHEANAVFAADAVSRLTGVPGVVTVTAGPGVTNTITALKNAALAQSALVVLGGAAATILKGRGSLQDIDQLSIMKSICKWNASVSKVKDIEHVLYKAFWKAQEGVPGPVFVECPIDILYGEELVREWYGAKSKDSAPRNLKEKLLQRYINYHVNRLFSGKDRFTGKKPIWPADFPHHRPAQIRQAVNLLKKAEKPLLIIGSGAMMQPKKANELATAVEKMGIPVYLSGMARGLMGRNHFLQMRHKRKIAVKNSDLILLAGVPNDFRMDYGNHIGRRKFISVNRSRADLNKNKRPTLGIPGDPMDFLIELGNQFSHSYPPWNAFLQDLNQKREMDIEEKANESVHPGLNPLALFRHLEEVLDDDTILIADGGDFVATASYILRPRSPLSWLDPGVYGTLGVGAGFAIGAALVFPEKKIWIVYGDGSAGYSLMEYDTFKRFDLPVVSVIGNDACWTQIARDQVEFLGSDCALNLDYSDYHLIPKAFGGNGVRVESSEEWGNAVKEAQKSQNVRIPFLINAIIGKTDFRKGSISM